MRLADGNLYLHNSLDGLASASHVLPVFVDICWPFEEYVLPQCIVKLHIHATRYIFSTKMEVHEGMCRKLHSEMQELDTHLQLIATCSTFECM